MLFTLFGTVLASGAVAQGPGSAPRPTPPQQPNPEQTIPERIEPRTPDRVPDSRSQENLSEELRRNQGVVRPPGNVAPDMPVIRPPETGTTPVIPPPPPGQTPQR